MTRVNTRIAAALLVISFFIPAIASAGEKMGMSGGYDLDLLVKRAAGRYDLEREDAILLLESETVSILDDGSMRRAVRQVVWINTRTGIHDYADLRIPWNSATSAFKVLALRTWRDGRWWPHEKDVSPVAVVETLPYAFALADDYVSMRETMLLHDGIELPCVMETAYEIEEKANALGGRDGFFVFSQRDPALVVEHTVEVPESVSLKFHPGNGAPMPETAAVEGRNRYMWKMEEPVIIGTPLTEDPAAISPYVSWSTWASWEELGEAVSVLFDEKAVIKGELSGLLAGRIENAHSPSSVARIAASMVDELTRFIDYSSDFFPAGPRDAGRIYETAYGHALDRAVLAAAMFRRCGLEAEWIYRSSGLGGIDAGVPGLARMEEVALCVKGDNFKAFYDPHRSDLTQGPGAVYGRAVFRPASGEAPSIKPGPQELEDGSVLRMTITLLPGEEGGWKGEGFYSGGGIFCPFAKMSGLDGEALSFIERTAGALLPGCVVAGYNPEIFTPSLVEAGFDFTCEAPKKDTDGRCRIEFGIPADGISSILPHHVHLYDESRTSEVSIPGKIIQHVRIRIEKGEKEFTLLPEALEISNEKGHFSLTVADAEGWITIDRKLTLENGMVMPEDWPSLRSILLEEKDTAGRTVVYE